MTSEELEVMKHCKGKKNKECVECPFFWAENCIEIVNNHLINYIEYCTREVHELFENAKKKSEVI